MGRAKNVSVAGDNYKAPDNARHVHWPPWDLVKLSPAHARIWQSKAPKILIHGGRDGGKDYMSDLLGVRRILEHYARQVATGRKQRLGPTTYACIAAPVSANYAALMRRFRDLIPDIPGKAPNGNPNTYWVGNECELFGQNQIVISFCSGKVPDNVRSNGFDLLIYTECAFEKESTIQDAFLPLVLGRSGFSGEVILNSTPGKRRGCWWDAVIKDARAGTGYWGDGWELHELTKFDNATASLEAFGELKRIKINNIQRYRREYMGWINIDVPSDAWVHNHGVDLAFQPTLLTRVLLSTPHIPVPPYYIGADLAGAGPDPFTCVVLDGAGVIVDVTKQATSNTESILAEFDRLNSKYHPRWIAYDASGKLGADVSGKLKLYGAKPIKPRAGGSKTELVLNLEKHFLSGSVRLPHPELQPLEHKLAAWNQRQLYTELCQYQAVELHNESVKNAQVRERITRTYTKPPDGNDDFVDALVYCVADLPVPTHARYIETTADEIDARRRRLESARVAVTW